MSVLSESVCVPISKGRDQDVEIVRMAICAAIRHDPPLEPETAAQRYARAARKLGLSVSRVREVFGRSQRVKLAFHEVVEIWRRTEAWHATTTHRLAREDGLVGAVARNEARALAEAASEAGVDPHAPPPGSDGDA